MGGTNYNAALKRAMENFSEDPKRNRYIIFLTDGEPTELSYNNQYYVIYSNNTARIDGRSANLNKVKQIINEQALNISTTIGTKGATMFSIGFANENDVDFELLQNMSVGLGICSTRKLK